MQPVADRRADVGQAAAQPERARGSAGREHEQRNLFTRVQRSARRIVTMIAGDHEQVAVRERAEHASYRLIGLFQDSYVVLAAFTMPGEVELLNVDRDQAVTLLRDR